MATTQLHHVIQHLRRAALSQQGAGLTDGELLRCFIEQRDEAAVAALVRRHGPMVWGVCRRVLHNDHDAEDAFQATFLVLVRKASAIVPREMVANWLYGVAHQTARKARATRAKQHMRERQVTEMPEPAVQQDLWDEVRPLLDQELSRLPDKYRVVIVLCDLEGKTRKEAARQLRCPEGTVASRLATARTMLAKRLGRHGLAVSGGALAAVLSQKAAPASVPPAVVSSTIQAATLVAAGQTAATGVISAKVAALTQGVLKTMLLTKLKIATAVLLVGSLIGLTAGAGVYQALATEATEVPKAAAVPAPTDAMDETKTVEENGGSQLPTGPVPTQALVSLDKTGQLVIRTMHAYYEPTTSVIRGQQVTSYRKVEVMTTRRFSRDDVKVYDVKGKAVDTKQLRKLLKEEIVALELTSQFPVDPLQLRLYKEGTLLFVLPLPVAPAQAMQVPPPPVTYYSAPMPAYAPRSNDPPAPVPPARSKPAPPGPGTKQ
jgi:RNA polymerase sigma factor (sigma-70 family)